MIVKPKINKIAKYTGLRQHGPDYWACCLADHFNMSFTVM
jgi:hypothetical protein